MDCFHVQVTTETAGCARMVTDWASARRVVVRETNSPVIARIVEPGLRVAALPPPGVTDAGFNAPSFSIALQRFGVSRFGIVMRRERIDRVDRLWNLPTDIRRH